MREVIWVRHLACGTEQSHLHHITNFIRFQGRKHPRNSHASDYSKHRKHAVSDGLRALEGASQAVEQNLEPEGLFPREHGV
ncbi:hypothetical protein [Meiothermus sp.]|uniref:hypothetical protein n=1 Tax=Meiothermus sp. TaxID=1955249 RepID=UPI0039A0E55F